jgi:uncharacterized protein
MKLFLRFFFLMCSLTCFAQPKQAVTMDAVIKNRPVPPRLVNDYAGILTVEQREALEKKLKFYDDSTSNQVCVVIVPSLGGEDIADAALNLGRAWGVGNKKTNNGVVLLISANDRKLNISPGYGLEKALPDLICSQIIQSNIVPYFKGNDYYSGIDNGTDAIIQATKGEYKAPEGYRNRGQEIDRGNFIFFILIALILLFVLSRINGGGGGDGGGTFMSRRGYRPFIFPTGGLGGGGWGGGGSSSGGGGFGGFGGGSFGGGGSSGSW